MFTFYVILIIIGNICALTGYIVVRNLAELIIFTVLVSGFISLTLFLEFQFFLLLASMLAGFVLGGLTKELQRFIRRRKNKRNLFS